MPSFMNWALHKPWLVEQLYIASVEGEHFPPSSSIITLECLTDFLHLLISIGDSN